MAGENIKLPQATGGGQAASSVASLGAAQSEIFARMAAQLAAAKSAGARSYGGRPISQAVSRAGDTILGALRQKKGEERQERLMKEGQEFQTSEREARQDFRREETETSFWDSMALQSAAAVDRMDSIEKENEIIEGRQKRKEKRDWNRELEAQRISRIGEAANTMMQSNLASLDAKAQATMARNQAALPVLQSISAQMAAGAMPRGAVPAAEKEMYEQLTGIQGLTTYEDVAKLVANAPLVTSSLNLTTMAATSAEKQQLMDMWTTAMVDGPEAVEELVRSGVPREVDGADISAMAQDPKKGDVDMFHLLNNINAGLLMNTGKVKLTANEQLAAQQKADMTREILIKSFVGETDIVRNAVLGFPMDPEIGASPTNPPFALRTREVLDKLILSIHENERTGKTVTGEDVSESPLFTLVDEIFSGEKMNMINAAAYDFIVNPALNKEVDKGVFEKYRPSLPAGMFRGATMITHGIQDSIHASKQEGDNLGLQYLKDRVDSLGLAGYKGEKLQELRDKVTNALTGFNTAAGYLRTEPFVHQLSSHDPEDFSQMWSRSFEEAVREQAPGDVLDPTEWVIKKMEEEPAFLQGLHATQNGRFVPFKVMQGRFNLTPEAKRQADEWIQKRKEAMDALKQQRGYAPPQQPQQPEAPRGQGFERDLMAPVAGMSGL